MSQKTKIINPNISLDYGLGEYVLLKESSWFSNIYLRIARVTDVGWDIPIKKPGKYVCLENIEKKFRVLESMIEKKIKISEAEKILDISAQKDFKDKKEIDKEKMNLAEKAINWIRGN